MCGIFGVVGQQNAARLVLKGLQSLEYRGYDSCGVVWIDGGLRLARAVGGVANLQIESSGSERFALGHTRWATHGGVTEANAHPHVDCRDVSAVVHNGVLLDYEGMKESLIREGHAFRSETDSEVLIHLWEKRGQTDGMAHLRALTKQLKGTYSLAILDQAENAIYVAKERNPLWIAATPSVSYLASDAVALKPHVADAIPLEDGDCARLAPGKVEILDASGRPVQRARIPLAKIDDHVDKAGYEHFMLKEIHESPGVLNRLLSAHVSLAQPYVKVGVPNATLTQGSQVHLLGAGTSFHAALLGAQYLQRLAKIPAEAHASPEYKDATHVPGAGALLVAMSQSGETLDTLQALHRLQSQGLPLLALTNAPSSSIGRAADAVVPLESGLEVGVAATKTFLSQTFLLYLLGLELGGIRGTLSDAALWHSATELKTFPRCLVRTLNRSPEAAAMARVLATFDHVFLLAKDLLLPAALEGALKLKEIAYQHAEAYPAGELKHGPFALLEKTTAAVFLLAPGPHEASVRNSLHEVRARGSPTFVIAMEGVQDPGPLATHAFWIPRSPPDLQPLVFSSALHLLSYWVAKARALPIDRPRNLAKSVTVE